MDNLIGLLAMERTNLVAIACAFLLGGLYAQGCNSMAEARAGAKVTVLKAQCDYEFPEAEGQFVARFTLPGATREELLAATVVTVTGPNPFGMPELELESAGTTQKVVYAGEKFDNTLYVPCGIGSLSGNEPSFELIVRQEE